MRVASAVFVVALAAPAFGQAPSASLDSGLWFGVRAGYAVPSGDVEKGGPPVRDVVDRELPFSIDLGYRFNRWVWGDLYIQAGPAKVADASCPSDVSCVASDARFGLAVQVHLSSRGPVDPWIGAGVGIEVLNAERWDPTLLGVTEWSWAGIDLPAAEAGIDFTVSRRFSLGPYASLSVARFTSVWQRPPGGSTTRTSIDERASHSWVQAGLRALVKL